LVSSLSRRAAILTPRALRLPMALHGLIGFNKNDSTFSFFVGTSYQFVGARSQKGSISLAQVRTSEESTALGWVMR